MTPLSLLFLLASVDGDATTGAVAAEPAPAPAEDEYEDTTDEAAMLKKRGIPTPPADTRKYAQWRRKLPKATQAKLAAFCRAEGGTFRAACNGIGPYSIPMPPRLTSMNGEKKRKAWYAALTMQQQRYVDDYCSYHGNDDEFEAHAYSDLCGATPIVFAFGSERVQYSAGDTFDWPTETTPWLAHDASGDGAIAMDELFAGFAPLRALDTNNDGVLDARDPAFSSLVLWADRDGNRASSADELTPVSRTVSSISLATNAETICDARGNCEGDRAAFTWRDATGAEHTGTAIDVYLHLRD